MAEQHLSEHPRLIPLPLRRKDGKWNYEIIPEVFGDFGCVQQAQELRQQQHAFDVFCTC